jgi:hypothetical protein
MVLCQMMSRYSTFVIEVLIMVEDGYDVPNAYMTPRLFHHRKSSGVTILCNYCTIFVQHLQNYGGLSIIIRTYSIAPRLTLKMSLSCLSLHSCTIKLYSMEDISPVTTTSIVDCFSTILFTLSNR